MSKTIIYGKNDLYTWCKQNYTIGDRILKEYIDEHNLKDIGKYSSKKLKMKCILCNNIYYMDAEHLIRNQGCPSCNGNNIKNISDDSPRKLINTFPEIAKEFDAEKNKELDINDITVSSNKKVWWKCSKCGKGWEAYVNNRTSKSSGCPHCSQGNNGSFLEYAIFLILNEKYGNAEYQFKINNMSFDIGIPNPATVIEYQGRYYHNNKYSSYDVEARDRQKREFVESYKNIKYITINETYGGESISLINNDIYFNANNYNKIEVLKLIISKLEILLDTSIHVRDDIIQFTTSKLKLKEISNSLMSCYPSIAEEWNNEKNGSLKPIHIKPKSNKKVWWRCKKCGYEWETTPAHRVADNTGCPKCVALSGSGAGVHMVIEGINDLKTLKPEIAKEWYTEYNKEIGLDLDNIAIKSNRMVWWKCSKCGKIYKDKVVFRTTRNHNCPICNNEG